MAKKSLIFKQSRRKAKFKSQIYLRCTICGRPHGVLRKFRICRICFRTLAYKGYLPGIQKSS